MIFLKSLLRFRFPQQSLETSVDTGQLYLGHDLYKLDVTPHPELDHSLVGETGLYLCPGAAGWNRINLTLLQTLLSDAVAPFKNPSATHSGREPETLLKWAHAAER